MYSVTTDQSTLGELRDDDDYDKEQLHKQREEVAMLKEQLDQQVTTQLYLL